MSDEALVASGKGGDDNETSRLSIVELSHSPWHGNVSFSHSSTKTRKESGWRNPDHWAPWK